MPLIKTYFPLGCEQVLKYPDNMKTEKLPHWFLTLKLAVLLPLTLAGKGHEIAYLDVRYVIEKENPVIFYFSRISTSWKRGISSKTEFFVFPKDQKLCVVACLKEFLKRSQRSRVGETFKASYR